MKNHSRRKPLFNRFAVLALSIIAVVWLLTPGAISVYYYLAGKEVTIGQLRIDPEFGWILASHDRNSAVLVQQPWSRLSTSRPATIVVSDNAPPAEHPTQNVNPDTVIWKNGTGRMLICSRISQQDILTVACVDQHREVFIGYTGKGSGDALFTILRRNGFLPPASTQTARLLTVTGRPRRG